MTVKKTASGNRSAAGAHLASSNGFVEEMMTIRSAAQQKINSRYFTGPFPQNKVMGVRMGDIFKLAKKYEVMPLSEIKKLLAHSCYEARMGAVSIMDFQARNKKTEEKTRKALFDAYLDHHDLINNWDLVDRSAPHVVGGYLFDKPRKSLYKLARSRNPLERRTAIVATWFFIRQGELEDCFAIAALLVKDKDELVSKPVGSWLREAGKRNKERLLAFLDQYAPQMQAVSIRYATEKLDKKTREKYLKLTRNKSV